MAVVEAFLNEWLDERDRLPEWLPHLVIVKAVRAPVNHRG
jgi:hypothetical protein